MMAFFGKLLWSAFGDAGPFGQGRSSIDDGIDFVGFDIEVSQGRRVMALLIEGRYLVAQFKLFVIGQQDQNAEGNSFAMEMAFDDLRQDRRRVIEHVSQGRIVVVVAAARRTVGNEARADDDIQDDLLQGIGDLLGLEIFQGLFTILQERRRAGFADGPAQEDRMEVFRCTAGQFRFTFFTHSIADAGPEEL